MAKAVLLLVLVVQVLGVLAATAARPLVAMDRTDGLLGDGMEMVTQIFGAAKSGPNPPSHCCS
ncbi:hypothetical protein HU200_001351 [Digitaria exilis]|uniref:Uncharacterized protein n=1 Tax=Digitaria exilis TaxID=1010633 RepID=A0A835FYV2_9POAL|nr:hypothetical protein HU200_001351 [Digitaria exilis]